MTDDIHLREGRDDDSAGLITLLGDVFAEYPGCVLDVDGEMPELLAIATTFAKARGRFWIAERSGAVVACVGFMPIAGGIELKKLYVDKSARRHGLGARLCDLVEGEARALSAKHIDLWSDTRFLDAHRLYEKRGYVRGAATRELHDKSDTVEFFFRRSL